MASHDNSRDNVGIMHTSYPGHIYGFDPVTQTCSVQLAIDNLFVGMKEAYTLNTKQRLRNVPVQFFQGGGWSLTSPIPDGTPCYVHFAMRGIDHWLAENLSVPPLLGGKPGPAYSKMFSHTSAVCTVGNQPIPKAIGGFNNSDCELRNADRSQRITLGADKTITVVSGNAKVVVNPSGEVTVEASSKTTIKSPEIILDGATTVTKSLTVQGGMSVTGSTGGQTMTITGNIAQTGSFTINGIKVDGHKHVGNGAGNDTGVMK